MAGSLIIQPFANAGDVTTPPQTDPNGFVNFNQGYTPFYEIELGSGNPQAKAVERQVQNALFKIATENIQAWQQMGFPEWYSSMPGGYDINAVVIREDGFGVWRPYRSQIVANSSDPLVSPANWQYIPSPSEAIDNVPMPAGGSGGSAAEIVSVATNFNSFSTGTWEFQNDVVAAGSPNAPVPPGGTASAGLLEVKSWADGGNTLVVQRYLDRAGHSFFRGALNGAWTAWSTTAIMPTYSVDTSVTANLVSATFPLTSSSLEDNAIFWVKIANANSGPATFTPNPAVIPVALPVVGQANLALQGSEMVVGGRAMFIYKADTNNFVLEFCSGGARQVPNGNKSNQSVNFNQLNAYATDVSVTPNAIQAAFDTSLTTGNIADNQRFWVKAANANSGPTTFTPNPGTFAATAVIGQAGVALQGGEIVVDGRICLIWKADTANFILADSLGGNFQTPDALASRQAVSLQQVQALITASSGASDAVLYRLGFLL